MKAMGVARDHHFIQPVAQQIHDTLQAREAEYELVPAIIGARNESQLRDNRKSADLILTEQQRQRLDAVSAPVLRYPYWHQAQTASDRLSAADLSLLGPYRKC